MKYIFLSGFIIVGVILEYFRFLDHPSILGLYFDVIGAYFLAQSFIAKKLDDIVCESWGTRNKYYTGGMSENLGQSFYQQSVEARTGFLVLLLGFTLQGIGNLFPEFRLPIYTAATAICILLITLLITHRLLLKPERIAKLLDTKDRELSNQFKQ
jgi:hypothetical protein